MLPSRLQILNVSIDTVKDIDSCLEIVSSYLESNDRLRVIFASNPEKNFSIPKEADLYKTFKDADLLLPDGIGMVLAARFLYGIKLTRIPGADLMEAICSLAARKGYKIFIYGAKEEINRKAVSILRKKYPKLMVVGRSHGYVADEDMDDLIEKINRSRAEILFIALGSPKQEKWIAKYKYALKYVRICQGIGGTLDTIAGNVKRAPISWRRCNLEWLYRLISEPKRIKRQKILPLFAMMVIKSKFKKMKRRCST